MPHVTRTRSQSSIPRLLSVFFLSLALVAVALRVGLLRGADVVTNAPAALDSRRPLEFLDARGQVRPVTTAREWQRRRAMILDQVQSVMGPMPGHDKRCALDPRIEEEVDAGDYIRRLISYSAEPRSRVPAYLLVPKSVLDGRRRARAVLTLHQTHRSGHRVVVGLGESPDDEYGVELVRRGYVCLAPAYPLLAEYHPDLQALGYASGSMKAIWDNRRGLDYLETLPFVKRGRFAAIGHSLGGHNAVFTAVFDERIRVVVSSCGLDSFRDYMDGDIKGWTSERYMPRLRQYALDAIPFDFHELIGALAPRVCFLSAPVSDSNFKWRSVDRIAQAAWPVFDLYDRAENLVVAHPDCGHRFPAETRAKAYALIESGLR